MKAHLQKLESDGVVKNLVEFESAKALVIIDWDADKCKEQGVPDGHEGCRTYHKNNTPMFTNGKSPHAVEITCTPSMDMISIELNDNAWRKRGVKQCDAILFPASDNIDDAVLFVETKYTVDEDNWQSVRKGAKKQIKDTIRELQDRGCPLAERTIYGLLSPPLLWWRSTKKVGKVEKVGPPVFGPVDLRKIYREDKIEFYDGYRVAYTDARTIEPA